jgi:acetyltransferase
MRTEDVVLYRKMLDVIPAEDLFLRFCSVFGDATAAIPTELIANLIHFDYSRDMMFVAIGANSSGEPEVLGVAEAFLLLGREQAEYSILVRSDLGRSGLGSVLMEKVIGYCRSRRLKSVFGLVLRRNTPMLALCAKLGFAKESSDEDDDMIKVVLRL